MAWAIECGLVSSPAQLVEFERSRYAEVIAGAFPKADQASLQVAMDWTLLNCAIDDRIEQLDDRAEGQRWLGELLCALEHGVGPNLNDPLARGLADVGRRLRALASQVCAGFTAAVARQFAAFERELELRATPTALSIPDYFELRHRAFGLYTYFALGPLLVGAELPPAQWRCPKLGRAMASTSHCVLVLNDVVSHERELDAGLPFNLVLVLMRARGCSKSVALAEAVHTYETARAQLDAELAALGGPAPIVDMLWACVETHHDWALSSGRYPRAQPLQVRARPLGTCTSTSDLGVG